jgi:hypothetical protein
MTSALDLYDRVLNLYKDAWVLLEVRLAEHRNGWAAVREKVEEGVTSADDLAELWGNYLKVCVGDADAIAAAWDAGPGKLHGESTSGNPSSPPPDGSLVVVPVVADVAAEAQTGAVAYGGPVENLTIPSISGGGLTFQGAQALVGAGVLVVNVPGLQSPQGGATAPGTYTGPILRVNGTPVGVVMLVIEP